MSGTNNIVRGTMVQKYILPPSLRKSISHCFWRRMAVFYFGFWQGLPKISEQMLSLMKFTKFEHREAMTYKHLEELI